MNNSGKRLGNLLGHFLSVTFVLMEWKNITPGICPDLRERIEYE